MKRIFSILALVLVLFFSQDGATKESKARDPYSNATGIDKKGFDTSVRPQDDFFRYVNGAWIANTDIPGDLSRWGVFNILNDQSEQQQRAIIEELSSQTALAEGTVEQKIGDFYSSLTDASLVEGRGAEPIVNTLKRVDAISNLSDLYRAFGGNGYLGITAPLATYVYPDLGNSTRYMVYISQSGLGLPDRDYYLKQGEKFEVIRTAYPAYIAKLFELAHIDNAAARAANVIAAENKLAQAHWPAEDNRDVQRVYNLRHTDELTKISPRLAWNDFLEGAGLLQQKEVVVEQLSYFETLGDLVRSLPLEAWKDYLRFHTLDDAAPFLSSEFEDAQFAFRGQLIQGLEEKTPRWKRAVRVINYTLGEGVGKVYVERHFPPEAKAGMEKLVANILDAFRTGIQGLEWMSEETKAKAELKRSMMVSKIGYPEKWETYEGIEIVRENPIANLMSASRWAYQDNINKLQEAIDRTEWGMTPQTINAYYNPTFNEIVFPAAILQRPFYNLQADPAVNYGAIGAVIGHEIGHAFDDQGRKFDGDGNFRDWWQPEDAEKFEKAASRLVAQYSAFEVLPKLHVNGQLTLGENIGDLTGVTLAYRAYKQSLGTAKAPVIGGLTGDQRFFMGYAQAWRSKAREEQLRNQVLTDPHSPAEFRVNGILRNFTPFYEAFGVKEEDGMYLSPDEQVKIW